MLTNNQGTGAASGARSSCENNTNNMNIDNTNRKTRRRLSASGRRREKVQELKNRRDLQLADVVADNNAQLNIGSSASSASNLQNSHENQNINNGACEKLLGESTQQVATRNNNCHQLTTTTEKDEESTPKVDNLSSSNPSGMKMIDATVSNNASKKKSSLYSFKFSSAALGSSGQQKKKKKNDSTNNNSGNCTNKESLDVAAVMGGDRKGGESLVRKFDACESDTVVADSSVETLSADTNNKIGIINEVGCIIMNNDAAARRKDGGTRLACKSDTSMKEAIDPSKHNTGDGTQQIDAAMKQPPACESDQKLPALSQSNNVKKSNAFALDEGDKMVADTSCALPESDMVDDNSICQNEMKKSVDNGQAIAAVAAVKSEEVPSNMFLTIKEEAEIAPKKKKQQISLTQGNFLVEDGKDERRIKQELLKSEEQPTKKGGQVTLTQSEFFAAASEENASSKQRYCVKSEEGTGMISVAIKKRGTIRDTVTVSKGDIWQSDDHDGVLFMIGEIYVNSNKCYEAEISRAWLRLEKTYIGPELAATVIAARPDCEFVIVEQRPLVIDQHELIPQDGRIQLNTLCNKLSEDEKPKTTLFYNHDWPNIAYYTKYDDESKFTLLHPNDDQHSKKPIALDLFAGCGGMSSGLRQAGWNVKHKLDNNAAAVATLRKNFPNKKIYNMDIARFWKDLQAGKIMIASENIVYIHGSPPCQGYCLANTSGGDKDWEHKQCTIDFLKVIEHIQPAFVSMENVSGMAAKRKAGDAKVDNMHYLQLVLGTLLSLGYDLRLTQAVASNFGDPQERKRLIVLAAKQGYKLPDNPIQTHGEGEDLLPIVTVKDVLQDLEDDNEREIERNESGWITLNKNLPNEKEVHGHFLEGTALGNKKKKTDDIARLYEDQPAKTLKKKNKMQHYNTKRYLTILEYKRLQSFPDELELQGTISEMRDQIGNAVPCKFAEAIGRSVNAAYSLGKYIPRED